MGILFIVVKRQANWRCYDNAARSTRTWTCRNASRAYQVEHKYVTNGNTR